MSQVANMLIKIKNAQAIKASEVAVPFSNFNFEIAKILKEKGFIKDVEKKKRKGKKSEMNFLNVQPKYIDGKGAIDNVKLISKPSRRIYTARDEIRIVRNGFGVSVISTSKGLMVGEDAKKAGLGGELLFEIW